MNKIKCPVCARDIDNLAQHFRSMYRVKLDKHKEYAERDKDKVNCYVNSLFDSDLSAKEVAEKTIEELNPLFFNLNKVLKIWRDSFGDEKLENRFSLNMSKNAKNSWINRDEDEKKNTTTKWYKASVTERKIIRQKCEENSNTISKLVDQNDNSYLELITNVKEYKVIQYTDNRIQCQLCGESFKRIPEHIIYSHNIMPYVYKKLFPDAELVCVETKIKHNTAMIGKTRKISLIFDYINPKKQAEFNLIRNEAYKAVLVRDKCCQVCGEKYSVEKRKLFDIHHMIPQRMFFKYDVEQNDVDNLILLCKECHAKVGQKLDLAYLSIFEILLEISFPILSKSIIKYLKEKRVVIKRKVGTPKKYPISVDQIKIYIKDSMLDVKKASAELNVPIHILKTYCREKDIAFVCDFDGDKQIKTKKCPVCNWSGSFQFTTHLLETKDEKHIEFLKNLQELSKKMSGPSIAEKYIEYNFTKAIVNSLLREINC
jgi:HNH endonuclease